MRKWLFLGLCGSLLLSGCRCPSQAVTGTRDLARLFSGFVYVGHRTAGDFTAEHGCSSLPLPAAVQVGQEYIFHHRSPVDLDKLAFDEFPARLRGLGFKILSNPDRYTGVGLLGTSEGGPLFGYKVRRGECRAVLAHRVEPRFRGRPWFWQEPWAPSDFVLRIDSPCEL